MPIRLSRRAALAVAALTIGAAPLPAAMAQSEYPSRPVRILVGSPAGGATDITARIVTEGMAADFPRGFAIEPRTGAGGNLAAETVARAAPDGYTLLVNDAPIMAVNPVLYARMGFDPERDFAPIALMAEFPFVVVVNPAVPATTLAEFVAWAKAQPDPILYGSPSAGSQQHLGMEQLAARLGIRVTNVPYRGGAPATMDLLAGQIKVGSIGLPPLVPHLRAGTLRALAVSTGTRSPLAPDVPTISEAGAPGLELAVWYGMVAPRSTPEPIIRFIEAALKRALSRPETVAKLAEQGLSARFMDTAAFDAFLKAEIASWGAAARASGIRLN